MAHTLSIALLLIVFNLSASNIDAAQEPRPEIVFDQAEIYYMVDFYPRFQRNECIVRINVDHDAVRIKDPVSILFREFSSFLRIEEPEASVFLFRFKPKTQSMYLMFAEHCNRRFDVAQSMTTHVEHEFPMFRLYVDPGHFTIGADTILADGPYWTDEHSFDSDAWNLRRRAHHGDLSAMLRLAELQDPAVNVQGQANWAFAYYQLAYRRMPDGPEKEKIGKKVDRIFKSFSNEMQQTLSTQFEKMDHIIRVYGERMQQQE